MAELHDAEKLARTSIERKLYAIRSFSLWATEEGFLKTNPVESLRGPRHYQRLPNVPSETEMQQLLAGRIPGACPLRDRAILELLYGSGLRAAELVGINCGDFRDGRTLLVRGKGNKERLVPVGARSRLAIQHWKRERAAMLCHRKTDALFFSVSPNRGIERLTTRSVGRIVKAAAVAKGLPPYHPHLLRHACATHMHDHDASLQAIAQMLGHARLATATVYTRVSLGRMMRTYRQAHPHAAAA